MDRRVLREILLGNELIDEERLRELEGLAAGSGEGVLATIVDGGYVREETLAPLVGEYFGIPWHDLAGLEEFDPRCFAELPKRLRETPSILPLYRNEERVVVATSEPARVEILDALREATGWSVAPVYSSQRAIDSLRAQAIAGGNGGAGSDLPNIADEQDEQALEELANEAPVIKRVNLLIMQAISEGASDIHVEPYEEIASVRYRVDGVLREVTTYGRAQYPAIVSRIKIMADLDIAERRVPQDGRISVRLMDREYDLRVATIPVLHGEGVVMRILDKGSVMRDLGELGFAERTLARFRERIARPHGILLVTGPTGSGKTTTLYAALSAIRSGETKMITIEDPVEYEIDGMTQIQVNSGVGLTFASGLRSILRLDPDVVMVGEIRDLETAEIAIRASLTGHAVYSTLHTNDASTAVTRLLDMDLPPYLVSSTLNAVLAQRLVRSVCEFCREAAPPNRAADVLLAEANVAPSTPLVRGAGCEQCNRTGYSGRTGIHELLEIDDEMRMLINRHAPADEIRRAALASGMHDMRADGVQKMIAGATTAEEILRVTQGS